MGYNDPSYKSAYPKTRWTPIEICYVGPWADAKKRMDDSLGNLPLTISQLIRECIESIANISIFYMLLLSFLHLHGLIAGTYSSLRMASLDFKLNNLLLNFHIIITNITIYKRIVCGWLVPCCRAQQQYTARHPTLSGGKVCGWLVPCCCAQQQYTAKHTTLLSGGVVVCCTGY